MLSQRLGWYRHVKSMGIAHGVLCAICTSPAANLNGPPNIKWTNPTAGAVTDATDTRKYSTALLVCWLSRYIREGDHARKTSNEILKTP